MTNFDVLAIIWHALVQNPLGFCLIVTDCYIIVDNDRTFLMVQYLQNLRLKGFNVKLWMAIKQREIQLQTLFRMLSIIYKVLNWVQVENII